MSKNAANEVINLSSFMESSIKYKFINEKLLIQAFTHKSQSDLNYERLELLGDAIIRLVVTHFLYSMYDNADEGSLSREIQKIISRELLAEISLKLGLVNLVKANNIRLNDHNLKMSISTDLFESMIGAIYLDSNYETTKNIILRLLQKNLQFKKIIGAKDPKTLLQEYCQAKNIDLPVYTTTKLNKIEHNPRFLVTCELISYKIKAESNCKNVQVGQKHASSIILEKLNKYEKDKNSFNGSE